MRKFIGVFTVACLLMFNLNVSADVDFNESIYTEYVAELDELIAQCEAKGINTQYEKISRDIINNYIPLIRIGNDAPLEKSLEALTQLYQQAEERLEGYLAGTTPVFEEVKQYGNSGIAVSGDNLITPNGESFFSVGMGHFNRIIDDMPILKSYGFDNIQTLSNFSSAVERGSGSGEYSIKPEFTELLGRLDTAYNEKTAVDLLLGLHYFPDWLIEELGIGFADNVGFFRYDITDESARQVIEDYLRMLLPKVKDHPAIVSFTITNEPAFLAMGKEKFDVMFREYLLKVHSTFEAIETAHDTDYGDDISSISTPADAVKKGANGQGKVTPTPLIYDWIRFNTEVLTEFHNWVARIVKEYAPNIPVHAKMMNYFRTRDADYNRVGLYKGANAESFAEFSDILGCDPQSSAINMNEALLTTKLKFYDYLGSIKSAPIYNSEDHIIADGDNLYDPIQAKHVEADMWQGAIHGRDMSAIWVWESYKNGDTFKALGYKDSIINRPDAVEKAGRAALNMKRLSKEVQALQDAKSNVVILYSDSSRFFNYSYTNSTTDFSHMQLVDVAYRAALFSGQKITFATEKNLAQKLVDNPILILPGVTTVTPSMLSALNDFEGKIIILSNKDTSLSKNMYNISLTGTELNTANAIKGKAAKSITDLVIGSAGVKQGTVDAIERVRTEAIMPCLADANLNVVELRDSTSGKIIANTEWRWTLHDGKILVNLCNYSNEAREENPPSVAPQPQTVDLYVNGVKMTNIKNLLYNEKLTESFAVHELEPMLLEVKTGQLLTVTSQEVGMRSAKVTVKNDQDITLPATVNIIAKAASGNDVIGMAQFKRYLAPGESDTMTYTFNWSGEADIICVPE